MKATRLITIGTVIVSCCGMFVFHSCKHTNKIVNVNSNDTSQVRLIIEKADIPNSVIKGYIKRDSYTTPINMGDIWIKKQRIPCNEAGFFNKELDPGTYNILVRGLNFNSIQYKITVKKGEIYNLTFNLQPYIFKNKIP